MSLYKLKKVNTVGNFSLLVLVRPYKVIYFNSDQVQYRNIKNGKINNTGVLCLYESICDDNDEIHDTPVKLDLESDWIMEYIDNLKIPETIEEQLKLLESLSEKNT